MHGEWEGRSQATLRCDGKIYQKHDQARSVGWVGKEPDQLFWFGQN